MIFLPEIPKQTFDGEGFPVLFQASDDVLVLSFPVGHEHGSFRAGNPSFQDRMQHVYFPRGSTDSTLQTRDALATRARVGTRVAVRPLRLTRLLNLSRSVPRPSNLPGSAT